MSVVARVGAAALLAAVAALSGAASGEGRRAAVDCLGSAATIVGTDGNDQLVGTEGDDVIAGSGGDDLIFGLGGNDTLCGGPGNDGIVPGPGNDRIDGGGGGAGPGFLDLVLFTAPGPVHADLGAQTATGEGNDTLLNITGLAGTRFGDTLVGNGGVNDFFPEAGDDVVDGRGGDDFISFLDASGGVVANLATGTATGEGADRLVSIEFIGGSRFADRLIGNRGDNYFAGDNGDDVMEAGGGNDRLFGEAGDDRVLGDSGDDTTSGGEGNDVVGGGAGNDMIKGDAGDDELSGGGGNDVASYFGGPTGVQASLLVGRVAGQGLDKLDGVENLEGSQLGDRILGDSRTNLLFGNGGVDRIAAANGADFLDGGAQGSLAGGTGRDYCLQGRGSRRCEISGTPGAPVLIPDEPPLRGALAAAAADTGGSRAGVAMALPAGRRNESRELRAARKRMLLVFGGEVGPIEGRDSRDVSPPWGLFVLAAPPGTGEFRYKAQPTCRAARKPYRTTVTPPAQVEPTMLDRQREQVFWRGVLLRQNRRTGKLVRTSTVTPWATAIVQGRNVPTGFPKWTNVAQTRFVSSFRFTVPPGTYAWMGKLMWSRTGAEVVRFIEPHIVETPRQQPDKRCRFGRRR